MTWAKGDPAATRLPLRLRSIGLMSVLVVAISAAWGAWGRCAHAIPAASRPTARASLATTAARRLQAALHVPVSIGGLRFRLLSASFDLRDLRVGAGRAPILEISHLNARPALSQGAERRLLSLDVRGFVFRLLHLFSRGLVRRAAVAPSARVDVLRASKGTIVLGGGVPGGDATIQGVTLMGRGLRATLGRRGLKLSGRLVLKGSSFRWGSKTLLRDLELELRGGRRGGIIPMFTAQGWGGKITARGRLRFRAKGPLRLYLVGRFESAALRGRFSVTGPLSRLRVSVSLRSRRGRRALPLDPRPGNEALPPGLRLRVRRGAWRIIGRLNLLK